MQAFGAELTIVPSEGGVITPDLIPRMIEKAKELAAEPGTYFTDQFNNRDALVGHRRVGEEMLAQVPRPLDVFCTAVGTAGFSMGVAGALREASPKTRVVLFEPASTAVISGNPPGTHHVEGIGVGFVPPLLDKSLYDEVRAIEENEARAMARRLAAEEGLLTGISSGLNVVGAIGLAKELGSGHTVATVAVDTGLKYLAGDLYAD
jgi:cysteine synthase A